MKNRVGRVIVGILALILLGFYTYKQEQIHWHSDDLLKYNYGEATGLHPEGFHADTVIGQETEEPVQTESPEQTKATWHLLAKTTMTVVGYMKEKSDTTDSSTNSR